MRQSFSISFILLITLSELFAQKTKVVPPSPESTSIFKFAEVPVSMYTGLPNISVPLYEIQLKRMTIPVQVSYNARGIKVSEIAPRVGLGWALSYGGMISRQIRGKADDGSNGYLWQTYYNDVFTDANLRASMQEAILNLGIDRDPDQFFFEMNGRMSGKFIFDQVSKQILQQKFSDVKITPIYGENRIMGWVAIDDQGNKFYYGVSKDGQRTAVDYDVIIENYSYSQLNGMAVLGHEDDDRAINTWHLMDIETPFNEHVEFYYEEETAMHFSRSFDKKNGSDVVCYFSNIYSHQQQIKDIVFDNGKVSFSKSETVRDDLDGSYVLDEVGVYDDDDELLKKFSFQYQYTTSPNDNNQLTYLKNIDPKASKRLFLNSIQEKGHDGQTIPPYTFQYNATLLPNRFSNSQDIWGYFNGKPNGEYLTFFQYGTHQVDRQVDVDLSEAGLMTRMTYPTGASVLFTYEQNFALPPPFMQQLLYPQTTETTVGEVTAGFLKNSRYYDPDEKIYTDTITIGATKTGLINFEFDLPYCSGTSEDPSYCEYQVYLTKDGVNEIHLYPTAENLTTFDIDTGTYLLVVDPLTSHDPSIIENLFYVNLSWSETVTTVEGGSSGASDNPVMAAGKRIKKIEYIDADSLVLTKEYSYLDPAGKTSGEIFGLPDFYYIQQTVNINGTPTPIVDAYGSLPGSPLTNLQGNSVGYSYVTEYFGSSNENRGKTEYEFTTTEDGGEYYTFPYHLPIDNEWLRGKSLSTKFYASGASGTYNLIKTIENSYLYSGNSVTPGPFMQPFLPEGSPYVYSHTRSNFYLPLLIFTSETGDYKTYYQTGGTFDLKSTVETEYEDGQPELTKQTNYYYDYNHHYQLQGTETISSDGSSEFRITTYPNDYPSGTAFIDNMKTANLLSYPIEEVKYKNKGDMCFILSGKITKYKDSNPTAAEQVLSLENSTPVPLASFKFSNRAAGILPPAGSLSLYSPYSAYKPKINYDLYDANGNILQYTETDNMPVSYLWDYKDQYLIAEVKNALQNDVAYTSFEAEGKGNWSFTGTAITDDTAPTGKRAYSLTSGGISKSGLQDNVIYMLTYWTNSSGSPSVTGSGGAPQISEPVVLAMHNGWTRFQRTITNTSGINIAGSMRVDEVRLHPVHAQMTTYTYEPLIGVSSSTDDNGNTTYFEYDTFSRRWYIQDFKGNMLKRYQYVYKEN